MRQDNERDSTIDEVIGDPADGYALRGRRAWRHRYSTSEKGRARNRRYSTSDAGRARNRRYDASPPGLARNREAAKRYRAKARKENGR